MAGRVRAILGQRVAVPLTARRTARVLSPTCLREAERLRFGPSAEGFGPQAGEGRGKSGMHLRMTKA
jgi:hypothetical protein